MKDMDRWLGDGGMPIIEAVGARFESYGCDEQGRGWVKASWSPGPLACNPHGIVQAGVHSVLLDAAMNFAINTELEGKVVRMARQVAYAEAAARDPEGQLVSRSTGTFLLLRAED